MYHRVDSAPVDPWKLAVAPSEFDRQISRLRQEADIVPLARACSRRRSLRGRARPTVAITFDDGYACNLLNALPVLERYGAPATIFVATSFLGEPSFWWDRWAHIALNDAIEFDRLRELSSELIRTDAVKRCADRGALLVAVQQHFAAANRRWVDDALNGLAATLQLSATSPLGRPLDPKELEVLSNHPLVEIGAHSVTHRALDRIDPGDAQRELSESKQQLEAMTGRAVQSFAYPYGRVSPGVARMVDSLYRTAVTTANRPVSVLDRSSLIPRLHGPIDGLGKHPAARHHVDRSS
jgi:peptidoglycan/xylan/chitin deacetylase (PgdA/CDA1 family)